MICPSLLGNLQAKAKVSPQARGVIMSNVDDQGHPLRKHLYPDHTCPLDTFIEMLLRPVGAAVRRQTDQHGGACSHGGAK